MPELKPPFVHEEGFCWTTPMPESGDGVDDPKRSPYVLFEGPTALGPAHSSHSEIRMLGSGRYSHWGETLYFSTSDNSDPNVGGRTFIAEKSYERYFDNCARYAFDTLDFYLRHIGTYRALQDKTILEIGPGRDMGTTLLLASFGARVIAVESHFKGWDPNWHGPFMNVLLNRVRQDPRCLWSAPLLESCALQDFDPSAVRILRCDLEDLALAIDTKVDFAFSHSVLEHLNQPLKAMQSLAIVSRKGSTGVHRIDMRDHRNNQFPLEFLLLSDEEFDRISVPYKYTHGNRMRLSEWRQCLSAAGFSEIKFLPELITDPGYLDSFRPRLRQAGTRFASASDEDLGILSGVFITKV